MNMLDITFGQALRSLHTLLLYTQYKNKYIHNNVNKLKIRFSRYS